jgi:ankyrin repeat protein
MFMFTATEIGTPRNFGLSAFARTIAGLQREDGHWMSWDARPPQMYGAFASTAYSLRTLQRYASPRMQADTQARVERARRWLETHEPSSTEDAIYRLLGLAWAAAGQPGAKRAMDALLALQRTDGGWSQGAGFVSDAYSTAESLYALHTAGLAVTDPVYKRGLQFLTSTQAPDGSWLVRSRMVGPAPLSPPYFESGFPYGKDQFISATATAWSAIALMLTMEKKPQKPQSAAAPAVPEWMETAMFGTAAELKAALDSGLDPNQSTPGGTTLLMMASPDLEKTRLLLERGAKAETRAASGYSALLVASRFQGSAPTMRLLLDRGASVAQPQGKAAAFGANPVFWTAYSGDLEATKLLLDNGARIDGAVSLGGLLPPWKPIQIAAMHGDAKMVDLLASRGANVNEGDSFGVTPLSRAVLRNSVETARVLVARGAKVNQADPLGMTPLLYSATRDFGDTEMAAFLLSQGAEAKPKAAAQARQYGHEQLAQLMEK